MHPSCFGWHFFLPNNPQCSTMYKRVRWSPFYKRNKILVPNLLLTGVCVLCNTCISYVYCMYTWIFQDDQNLAAWMLVGWIASRKNWCIYKALSANVWHLSQFFVGNIIQLVRVIKNVIPLALSFGTVGVEPMFRLTSGTRRHLNHYWFH